MLVTDGRGTPNRGVAWEQSVWHDYLDPALQDQVEALHVAAERLGFLDLSKVAIRGWSYGGALVCAALLRRPDVFHAGIAGAPVTDMRLLRHPLHGALPGAAAGAARGLRAAPTW